MTAIRLRSLSAMLLAILCAAVLTVTSMLTPAFVAGVEKIFAEIDLLGNDGWIMSGTGFPDPTVGPYISQVEANFLTPSNPFTGQSPTFAGYGFTGVTTPEEFCPITACFTGLNFGESLNQGVIDLNNAMSPNFDGSNVVFGYSQSATLATIEMNNLLANTPNGMTLADQHFVLIGDPNNPAGGILDRFQFPDSLTGGMQHVPFVNIPLGIAPTPTTGFGAGAIYTGEYDGWANFPQDPTNLLADINALIGIGTVHGYYPDYNAAQLADTIHVGTIGNTAMYYIPENLPILQFMYNGSSTAGQFFGDAFSPWARLLIDWGYGNAGDPLVNGLYPISPAEVANGANIAGSPYEASVGVAGGPWTDTPYGDLWQSTLPASAPSGLAGLFTTDVASSGIAGFFMKMDPLQMIAGVQNALIQSLVGPWADVAAGNSATIPAGTLAVINDITSALQFITGYDLVNGLDQLLLTGLQDLGLENLVSDLFTGPLIPGQPVIDLVGLGFDLFNIFGA